MSEPLTQASRFAYPAVSASWLGALLRYIGT